MHSHLWRTDKRAEEVVKGVTTWVYKMSLAFDKARASFPTEVFFLNYRRSTFLKSRQKWSAGDRN